MPFKALYLGAQGLSEAFFFFFRAGPHGLLGPHGLAADLAALAPDTGASAARTTGAGTTMAVAISNAERLLPKVLRF